MKILTKKDLANIFDVNVLSIYFRAAPFAPNNLMSTKKIIQGNEIEYRLFDDAAGGLLTIYHPEWNKFIDATLKASIKIASFDSQIKSLSYETGSLDAYGKGIMGWAVEFENPEHDFFLAEPKDEYDCV